ncbi:MAG: SRPBCC family protein [Thermoleophilia bacterium]|nr:SRPBCC family protein [Thermoleophilia bacterium]
MPDVSRSIEIARDADAVFAHLVDFARAHEWQGSLAAVRVEHGDPVRVGTVVHETRRTPAGSQDVRYEVTELTPGRAYTFRGGGGPIRVVARVTVEPLADDRCRVTASFDFDAGFAGKLLLPLVRREAERELPEDQARLKALLEVAE